MTTRYSLPNALSSNRKIYGFKIVKQKKLKKRNEVLTIIESKVKMYIVPVHATWWIWGGSLWWRGMTITVCKQYTELVLYLELLFTFVVDLLVIFLFLHIYPLIWSLYYRLVSSQDIFTYKFKVFLHLYLLLQAICH